MQVKFRTNLGSQDAHSLGLDFKRCCEGMTLEVDQREGEKLVKSGVAIDVTPPAPKAETPKAEPKPEPVSEDKPTPKVHQPAAHSTMPGK